MGFDVSQYRTGCSGQCLQCADLIDHVGTQFVWFDINPTTAESGEIEVSDLCSDPHATRDRRPTGSRQAYRVAGVEAAGEVGTGDDVEHGVVIAEFPHSEALGEVGVEIY